MKYNKKIETGLNVADAKRGLDKAFEAVGKEHAEYKPFFGWKNDEIATFGFNVKGIKLNGTVFVLDDELEVDMDLPFMAWAFREKAFDILKKEVDAWVVKIKAGEI